MTWLKSNLKIDIKRGQAFYYWYVDNRVLLHSLSFEPDNVIEAADMFNVPANSFKVTCVYNLTKRHGLQ